MNALKLIITKSCRSDFALSDPLIKRIEKDPFFELKILQLIPANFIESYKLTEQLIDEFKPDLIVIIGDRIEVFGCGICALFKNIETVHLGAGITNNISTFDDLIRHSLTLFSSIQLCEDRESAKVVQSLFNSIKVGLRANSYIIGNPYIDEDLPELDFSLVPKEDYDLVLINPTTLIKDNITIKQERIHIVIGKNPDPSIFYDGMHCPTYNNLPRSQFLGLMKNCKRFISNSSSIYYECPLYLRPEQIIKVGLRNSNRSSNFEEMKKYPNTANRIITILKEWWLKNEKKV